MTSQSQGFLNNTATTWADYQVSRTYDLAGHPLTQNYPSGRSVTNSYAVSGRLNSFSGNIGGIDRRFGHFNSRIGTPFGVRL